MWNCIISRTPPASSGVHVISKLNTLLGSTVKLMWQTQDFSGDSGFYTKICITKNQLHFGGRKKKYKKRKLFICDSLKIKLR